MGWERHPPPRRQRPRLLGCPYGQAEPVPCPVVPLSLSAAQQQGFRAVFLFGRSLPCSFSGFNYPPWSTPQIHHCGRETVSSAAPDVLPGVLRRYELENQQPRPLWWLLSPPSNGLLITSPEKLVPQVFAQRQVSLAVVSQHLPATDSAAGVRPTLAEAYGEAAAVT